MLAVAPIFDPLLDNLLRRGRARVEQVVSSGPSFPAPQFGDRIRLAISHCGKEFSLWVLLQEKHPESPPDFIFGAGSSADEDEFLPPLSKLKTLSEWSTKSVNSLSYLVYELKDLFNEHQRAKAKSIKDDRIRFELDTMSSVEGVEFFVERLDTGKIDIHFSIPLLGISVEPLLEAGGPSLKDKITASIAPELNVKFTHDPHSSGLGKLTPQVSLRVAQIWTDIMGNILKPPAWTSESCLIDYIPLAKESIEEMMKSLTLKRSVVREFIRQTGAVVEYDSVDFRKVSFLGEYDSTPIMVTVSLMATFPTDPPLVTLQSMAHFSTRPLFRNLAKVPWSPRWTAEEMVKRTRAAVAEALSVFKKWCEDESS